MSQSHLPGHEMQPEEIVCGSCGRFVGALTRCPHCGARVHARMSVRFFRYAALLLATAGLFLLYLMATHREIPLIEIGGIKATMNFAYIRVAGKVTGEARINREAGSVRSVRFTVDDGTGEIPVTAFRAKGQELIDLGLVPEVGDRVEVTGSLSVSAESIALWVQTPEQVVVERSEVRGLAIGEITEEHLNSSIVVAGTISAVTPPRQGSRRPWVITVKDDSGSKDITFWQDVHAELEEKVLLAPGTAFEAQVVVGSFRDKLQLRLAKAVDLTLKGEVVTPEPKATKNAAAPEALAQVVELGRVVADMDGRSVRVDGVVKSVTPPDAPRAPYRVVLADGDDEIPLVYWGGVARRLGEGNPAEGARLRVVGRVNVYSNTVQLKVSRADHIKVLDKAGSP